MSKNHHGGPAPVPPGNRPQAGPGGTGMKGKELDPDTGESFQQQDPQRRLGGFETAGEHARQQPEPLNDGDRHSK